jgi:hypothetical protein
VDRAVTARRPAALAGLALMVLCSGCSGINSQTNSFATLAEARRAGAVEKGWMPDNLPPGSHDIREAHVPGTADRWAIINFPPEDEASLRATLQPDELPLAGLRCDIPRRIEWWPNALRGDVDAERLTITGLRAYRPRTGPGIFAVNWKQGRAYYWTK